MLHPGEKQKESVVKTGPFQAIKSRYIPATSFRGSRVKAITESGKSLTMSYDDSLSNGGNHAKVVKALIDDLNWGGEWHGAQGKDGFYFVEVER